MNLCSQLMLLSSQERDGHLCYQMSLAYINVRVLTSLLFAFVINISTLPINKIIVIFDSNAQITLTNC